uniref:Uncharacterized protein n=1 Tax=Arundo donax TaxID=35708 RepID=A0A0A9B8J4_ARUDO
MSVQPHRLEEALLLTLLFFVKELLVLLMFQPSSQVSSKISCRCAKST